TRLSDDGGEGADGVLGRPRAARGADDLLSADGGTDADDVTGDRNRPQRATGPRNQPRRPRPKGRR
ncbi:hypothetical protein, partial [Angustibacter aerolatus]